MIVREEKQELLTAVHRMVDLLGILCDRVDDIYFALTEIADEIVKERMQESVT